MKKVSIRENIRNLQIKLRIEKSKYIKDVEKVKELQKSIKELYRELSE